jgi:hypothetical protein
MKVQSSFLLAEQFSDDFRVNEKPRQRIAPIKKALKIIFSSQLTSHDGRTRKYAAAPMNIMQPSK